MITNRRAHSSSSSVLITVAIYRTPLPAVTESTPVTDSPDRDADGNHRVRREDR